MTLTLLASCSLSKKSLEGPVYDELISEFAYPFKVENFEFTSQRKKLHMAYMDLNSTSSKTIVLLHGKNFSGYYWERLAKDLVERGYRVIIPDQIGFGKSSKPRDYQFSFYNLALNTNKLLKSLNVDKITIVGHSMGGMLATHYTYLYPKAVDKLILVNPIGLEPYLKYVEYKDPEFFYNIELKKTPQKFKNYQLKYYYDGKWKPEYDKLLLPYSGQMRSEIWEDIAWVNALTYGPIFSEDITTKMPHIKNDVVIIVGTRDKTGPGRNWKKPGVTYTLGDYKKLGKKTKKSFPNAKLFELDNIGHMPHIEDYSRFKKVFFKGL